MARVLVIDGCPEFQKFAKRILQRSGFDVIEARDGLAGLQRAVEEVPDWILVDAGLPGLSGFEVCRQLRADAETRDFPVAIWSTLPRAFEWESALEAGADALIDRATTTLDLGEKGWALIGRAALAWMRERQSPVQPSR